MENAKCSNIPTKINNKTPQNIPTPQVSNNNICNDTMSNAKTTIKKVGRYNLSEQQNQLINNNINRKIEQNKEINNKIPTISLQDKKKRIQLHLYVRTCTIGMK